MDINSINRNTIALSKEYFIASTPNHTDLASTIGSLATKEIQKSVSEAVDGIYE